MADDDTRRPIVLQPPETAEIFDRRQNTNFDIEGSVARSRFREFFRNFRLLNNYIYRDALMRNWSRNEMFVEVDLAHLNEYDEVLFNNLQTRPGDILPYFEAGAKDALKLSLTQENQEMLRQAENSDFQIVLKSNQNAVSLRHLTADHVNRLIKVPGIIISCTKTRSKATMIWLRCTKCQTVKRIQCKNVMGGAQLPTTCDRDGAPGENCGPFPFVILADNCEYIDQQTMKLQESPEAVPTGEMPRNILLSVDRYLVDKITPGTRVSVIAISSLFNAGARKKLKTSEALRSPFLRVLGIQIEFAGGGRTTNIFSPQEEEEMQRLARDPEIYQKIAKSIAPQIQGKYTEDIKKALACLLMSGSRKTLPDGVKLRGDINVLLIGDPSMAKSQFLKFIEKVSPVGVYTSGKGSSAAGLTASVVKDSKGEFFLEGGAMVLADGGVICIDEFDKMREGDRVAIHEAMEQQTISIAKAGITTVLNCRASVLAAANPIFGRYDDLRSVGDNIDLMSTILSRFDCIFIVRDIRDETRDRDIAKHVLGVQINSSLDSSASGEISPATLKKYVTYCRERCAPRLSDAAAAMLRDKYVHIRDDVRRSLLEKPGEAQVVLITIRQLEALVRISESLAKMRLSSEATEADVEEAIRLFEVSTVAASRSDPALGGSIAVPREVERAVEHLKKTLGMRMTMSTKTILEGAHTLGHSYENTKRAIVGLIARGEVKELEQGRKLMRMV